MNQEDFIRMAREAGGIEELQWKGLHLERFAALVEAAVIAKLPGRGYYHEGYEAGVAAEREKVAAWMLQRSYSTGHGETLDDLLKELDWQIAENWTRALVKGVEGEREACAVIAETPIAGEQDDITMEAKDRVASAIRARGQ